MLLKYRLRVDLLEGQTVEGVEDLFRSMRDYCPVMFVVREVTGKVHWHGYVETNLKVETLRARVRKLFGVSGTYYKVGIFDDKLGDAHFRYLCKGENSEKGDPVNVVIDTEGRNVQHLHDAFHSRETRGRADGSRGTVLDQLIQYCDSKSVSSKDQVMNAVYDFYVERRKIFDHYLLARSAQTVWAHLGGVRAKDDITARAMERW